MESGRVGERENFSGSLGREILEKFYFYIYF